MADNIISSLKKRQIPVAGHDRLIITEHIAVMDLIAVGNFLLLPEDDLSLACVLKSPLIGITEDELFQIAHNRGSKSLWHSLRNQQDNFAEAVSYLSTLLNKVDFLTPFAFFCYVLEAQGGRKKILQRLGEEASDPVDEFLSMALSYEQSHAPSMQGFLSWLESGESIIKRDMEQGGADTVRVMTVHGSKGLEAPIVIMPDTTAVPDSRKTRIFWHESKSGNVMLWPGRSSNEDEICTEIKQRKLAEQEAEYYRLLYVAMTRAKSELYIAGTRGRNSINEKSWFSIIFSAMSGIADKDKDGILTFCGGIPENIEAVQSLSHAETPLLPRHFLVEPLPEPTPTRPLAPSKFEDSTTSGVCSPSNGLQLLEGKIIHSLLEFLPDIPSAERFAKGRQFLLNKFTPIPELLPRIDDILLNVLSIMNMESLKEVFGKNSRAEVPVVGTTNGVVVSGRIDRLAVSGDMVIIVDYKTGRIPPKSESHINAGYLKQMHIYQNLIGEIYHDKVVECYLIWTEGAVVYKLPAPVSNGLKLSMHN